MSIPSREGLGVCFFEFKFLKKNRNFKIVNVVGVHAYEKTKTYSL